MCTAIVSGVGMSAASFAFPLNRQRKVCANWIPHMLNEEWHARNILLATANIQ